jgi:phosphate transport system permease protein
MTEAVRPLRQISRSSRRSRRNDRLATVVLWATAALALALLGGIIVYLLVASIGVVSPAFLFGDPSDTELGGIFPFFWNSLYILGLTMLISTPIGILAGVYMAEYAAENRLTNAIRFAEEAISSVRCCASKTGLPF